MASNPVAAFRSSSQKGKKRSLAGKSSWRPALQTVPRYVDSFWPVNGNVLSTKTGSLYRVVAAYGRPCPSVWPDRNPRNGSFSPGLEHPCCMNSADVIPTPLRKEEVKLPQRKEIFQRRRGFKREKQNPVACCQVLGTGVWNTQPEQVLRE